MEAPAIIVGVLIIHLFSNETSSSKESTIGRQPIWDIIKHALTNGSVLLILGSLCIGFILSVLAASASCIAVPAAMKIAVPKAKPGIFIPMALAITFPFNITIGMPI